MICQLKKSTINIELDNPDHDKGVDDFKISVGVPDVALVQYIICISYWKCQISY